MAFPPTSSQGHPELRSRAGASSHCGWGEEICEQSTGSTNVRNPSNGEEQRQTQATTYHDFNKLGNKMKIVRNESLLLADFFAQQPNSATFKTQCWRQLSLPSTSNAPHLGPWTALLIFLMAIRCWPGPTAKIEGMAIVIQNNVHFH